MDNKTKDFLQKLKDSGNWNDDHDYSEVNYKTSKDKVLVIYKPYDTKHEVYASQLLKGVKLFIRNALNKTEFARCVINEKNTLKYDLSNFHYAAGSKFEIICPKHKNKFKTTYESLISGKGCKKCGVEKFKKSNTKTREYWLTKFISIHDNEFDYSDAVFKGTLDKILIRCKNGHQFYQSPSKHSSGQGCPECSGNVKLTQEEILNRFKLEHGNKFIYDSVIFKSIHKKVKIKCKKHGYFEQTPVSHYNGSGCPECSKNSKLDNQEWIKRFKKIHGNKYDYSQMNFKTIHSKIKIYCKKHDYFFYQSPASHFHAKSKCPKCSGKYTPTNDEWIERFKSIHENRYDYKKFIYKNVHEKGIIICKEHGEFLQSPAAHFHNKQGCPTCGLGWSISNIIRFINDIRNEDVLEMDPVELNFLISQGKLPIEFEELVFSLEGTGKNSLKTLKEKLGVGDNTETNEKELQRVSDELKLFTSEENIEVNEALIAIDAPSTEELELAEIEEHENKYLPSISNSDILVLDKELINTCDDEAVEFFIQYKLKKVWNEVINEKRNAEDIKLLKGGKNSTRLRELFIEEYEKVINYSPPQGYSFEREGKIAHPNMMQKLTVQRIKYYKRYGNWSGTGAGKTISFIIASREVESKLTVVICLNSTISQLEEDILEVYPDSLVHTKFKKGQKFDRTRYNYLLLNYEKFQQGYTEERFQNLNENNIIDFVVLDEIHNTKQRDKDESKRRGAVMRLIGRSSEMNPNFHLLGMSATPVINNLIEAKSLLQLITGKQYDDLSTRGTITNALKVFNQLLLNGIRYIPKYNIVLKELTGNNTEKLNINGESLVESLKSNDSKDYLGLEKILLEPKLEVVKEYLRPKTIIYTYFTDGSKIPQQIAKYIQSQGLTVSLYIGEQSTEDREASKNSFVKGTTDILIASRTIGTGVDGLQNVCNRMILLTLPWTDSEYTQLKGRIYRQGSKFGDVEIIIPQVYVDLDKQRWSWDKQRLQLIRDKRTLADAAVDGIIPSKHIPSKEKLCSDSLQALRKWKERVNEGKITLISRQDLTLPLRPEISESLRRSLGGFSELNKAWSTSRSDNTFKRLKSNYSEWYYYHDEYTKKRKEWDEIPYEEIAKKIKERPDWIIADMGCGENLLSKEIKNKVHAFDYVAKEGENVIACDMSKVPLNDQEVDAVVFYLSLIGSNHIDYLKEGFRILKPYGSLFICEPKKKAENRMEKFKTEIEDCGFKIIEIKPSSQFIYFNAVKI